MRPPQGQMVINMKTTITTHGAHNGFVVQSGLQSAGSQQNQNMIGPGSSHGGSLWSLAPSRIPTIETPGGSRIRDVSPLGIQMKPSTSQDNIDTSWNNISQQSPIHHRRTSYESVHNTTLPTRPTTPPSPVYEFSGRDSPPDEFIQPSRITLNVFNPGSRSPIPYDVGLRRCENGPADALINDTVTTTTTVEVFRTPLDRSRPDGQVVLPPPPVPALDDRHQLLRINGPPYERWSNTRSETLINDRPVQSNRGVQWKENLIEGTDQISYDPYSGPRSPFETASIPSRPPTSASHQYHIPTVHSIDQRLYSPQAMVNRSTSPYMVEAPSEYSQTSHPFIPNSQEELRRYPSSQRLDSAMSYNDPARSSYSPSAHAHVKQQTTETPIMTSSPISPHYVVPDRRTAEPRREPRRQSHRDSRRRYDETPDGYSTIDRRRSQSSHRARRRDRDASDVDRYQRVRSASPRRKDASNEFLEDPNLLPGEKGPSRASSKDIFNLYQTRDAFENVVAQFKAMNYGLGDLMMTSPLAESEDSLISGLSYRAEKTAYDEMEKSQTSSTLNRQPRPLHRTSRVSNNKGSHVYAEPVNVVEHIYEEMDALRTPTRDLTPVRQSGKRLGTIIPVERVSSTETQRKQNRQEMVDYITTTEEFTEEVVTTVVRPPTVATRPIVEREPEEKKKESNAKSDVPETENEPEDSIEEWPAPPPPMEKSIIVSDLRVISLDSEPRSASRSPVITGDSETNRAATVPSDMDTVTVRSPNTVRRAAHPDGLVFPRITSSVMTLPELTEVKEESTCRSDDQTTVSSDQTTTYEGELRRCPAYPEMVNLPSEPESPVSSEIPYADASPRPGSCSLISPKKCSLLSDSVSLPDIKVHSPDFEPSVVCSVVSDNHRLVLKDYEYLISEGMDETSDSESEYV